MYMDNYYNIIANGYDKLHKKEQLNKINIIKNNIKINKNDKLLDVGCGTGISSDFNCFCVGVDNSIGLLKQNKKTKIFALAENLPFKNNSIDMVISVTAIHNFNDINKSLREIKRVGRKKFVFSVLKKTKKFNEIESNINKLFVIKKVVIENKDIIFFTT